MGARGHNSVDRSQKVVSVRFGRVRLVLSLREPTGNYNMCVLAV